MTLDYVLYELSYENLLLYSSVIPSYIPDKDKKKKINPGTPTGGNAGGVKGLFSTLKGLKK